MPRKATDYNKTIIYKLVRNDDFDNANVYVGSTTDFIRRKSRHKFNCHNENYKEYNYKVYQNIRENGGWENWTMIEIEKYPCSDNREAEAREEWWRCEFNANLNTRRAFLSEEQKKECIKEKNKEYAETHKQYYIENSEKKKEYDKQYRIENAEKIKEYKKQYSTEHAEKIKEYKKKYRTENAEKIHQKYDCVCGSVYTHKGKSLHFKSKKHQNYIKDN